MELTWKILDAEKLNANGVIIKVVVACQAALGNIIDRRIKEVVLTEPKNLDAIVPFKDLTEVMLINWVKTILGDDVKFIEDEVTASVNKIKADRDAIVTTNGLPWDKNGRGKNNSKIIQK